MRRIRVFVSWSGKKSNRVAERISKLLPSIIPNVKVFFSANMRPGAVWGLELLRAIAKSQYAILCVTRDNLDSPWVNFEAGGIIMAGKRRLVCPLLIDLKPGQLHGPLGLFQARRFNKRDFLDICKILGRMTRLDAERLRTNYDAIWPQLEKDARRKLKSSRRR